MTQSKEQPIRVLVADPKQLWTGLLVERLRQLPGVKASANTSVDTFAAEVSALTPDVVLIGFEETGNSTALFEMMESIHSMRPQMRIVVLVNSMERRIIRDAFFAGASGVISPNESFEILMECVQSVYAGRIWLRHDQFGGFMELMENCSVSHGITNANESEALTDRQLRLVQCVAKGMTNREIALQLELSEHTVRNYLFRIFRKFGVSNRAELVCSTLHQSQAPYRFEQNPVPLN